MENLHLLEQQIEQLQVSDEFWVMCTQNKFKTIADIVKYPVSKLLDKPGFTMRMLMELIGLLKEKKLEDYLKD
jgi:DNA-directed RNA polymerase alpha subunit